MRNLVTSAIISTAALVAGCTSDDYLRADGLTIGAGNALAANTAMQMVDPWQEGVQNTKLRVPAVRAPSQAAGSDYSEGAEDSSAASED